MNTKLCLIAVGLTYGVACHAQVTGTQAAPELKWLEPTEVGVAARRKEAADFQAGLASTWTTLVVAVKYVGNCTGPEPAMGFQITRQGDVTTAAPWVEYDKSSKAGSRERIGEALPITKPQMESLLAKTHATYHAAMRSFTPKEIAGPMPENQPGIKAWLKRHLAAGGGPEGSDEYWLEVHVTGPKGITHHRNMWGTQASEDMQDLFTTFVQVTQK